MLSGRSLKVPCRIRRQPDIHGLTVFFVSPFEEGAVPLFRVGSSSIDEIGLWNEPVKRPTVGGCFDARLEIADVVHRVRGAYTGAVAIASQSEISALPFVTFPTCRRRRPDFGRQGAGRNVDIIFQNRRTPERRAGNEASR